MRRNLSRELNNSCDYIYFSYLYMHCKTADAIV